MTSTAAGISIENGKEAAPRRSAAWEFFRRYGVAVGSVVVATLAGLLLDRLHLHEAVFTFYVIAVAVSSWYAGAGPAILAFVAGALAFDYYFTVPLYTISFTRENFAYFLAATVFALFLIWSDVTRRRAEVQVRQSRDSLRVEVEQRQALNKELERRSQELEASNKELEAFAYSVSHDLRAPVRHIAGFTDLLKQRADPVLDDAARRHLGMIQDSASRMGALIDDLLAFSRIGRAEAHMTTVDLDQLARSIVQDIELDAKGRKIAWRIGGLPVCHGDPSMLRLALANLISNAVKFTRTREQAEIEIGSLTEKPDESVMFVRDNGVGFNPKYSHKLFGVFQRLHSQEAFEGTGIGLATVQRIVHRHQGRVWAEGVLDQGAAFYIALPKPAQTSV
jgi:light-regulated signal transduction histidine kinase (bacteriophytochrome)